jgi:hypothetical protein
VSPRTTGPALQRTSRRSETRVERDREQHEVADGGACHTELHEQRAVFLAALAIAIDTAIRRRTVTDPIEVTRDRRERGSVGIPGDVGAAAPQIDADVEDTGQTTRRRLDEPDACGTPQIGKIQCGMRAPIGR